MKKEIIICIVIISLVLIGNYITRKYEMNVISTMTNNLQDIKQELKKENVNTNQLNEKINNLNDEWNKSHSKMASFTEHDELEKVETNITALVSLCEIKDYMPAITEIDKSVFVLKHIKERNEFKLENIF